MPGGVRSMKGEKQMIYKNISLKQIHFHTIWNLRIELLLLAETAAPVKQCFMKCWKI